MSIKFTKTARGSEQGSETLLFQFLDHECPEKLTLDYSSDLVTNKFIGSLQTNQHNGIYLQPISWQGEFFGGYIPYVAENNSGQYMTAKERFDQLGRLQGRVIKFWYEGIKQLVIISKLEASFIDYNRVEYSITLQPHDIQIFIKPEAIKPIIQKSNILMATVVDPPKGLKGIDPIQIDITLKTPKIPKLGTIIKPNMSIIDKFPNQEVEVFKSRLDSLESNTRLRNLGKEGKWGLRQKQDEEAFQANPNRYLKQLVKDLKSNKQLNADSTNSAAVKFLNNQMKNINTPQPFNKVLNYYK